jgi:glycosyltransferase involved in cell wall biosynthesis
VTDRPLVDVLLPVRDAEPTLGETLASIRNQTFPDWRCLVLDDGSRDGSVARARAVAAEDPRVEVETGPAAGLVPTLRRGIERVVAPFVARIDADDVMAPDRLERQVAHLERDPSVTVVSSRVRFFGERVSANLRAYERWLNELLTHEAMVRDLFVESPLPHPSVTMRTEALRAIGGYRDLAHPEDYDLWLRAWRAGWRFGKCEEVLVRIRDHGGRLTKTDPRYTARAFLDCKTEHLVAAYGLAGRDVVVWGAGRDGKRAAKSLRRRGVRIRHLVDIAPTKLGRRTIGVPVLPPASLDEEPRSFVVAAVGVKGAREEIRAALADRGYREGADFVCLG